MVQHTQITVRHINKERQNRMVTPIGAGKASDKVQHPFVIKMLNELHAEGTHLNTVKALQRGGELFLLRPRTS